MTAYALHQLLPATTERFADRVAVLDGARRLTYGELDTDSNRLGRLLRSVGVSRGDRVALFLEKSAESVTAMHAILKAGAAYVPLDSHGPIARAAYIAADCGVRVVVTSAEKAKEARSLVTEGSAVSTLIVSDSEDGVEDLPAGVDCLTASDLGDLSDAPLGTRVVDVDLAYVLYTSGSTGAPKGVMLSHRNGLSFVEWAVHEFAIGPDDRLSNHAPLHFDLSIFDIFAACRTGATLALVPSGASVFPVELSRFIRERDITVWYSVPSILTLLALHGGLRQGDFPRLRTILFAGEVFPTKHLRRLMDLLSHVEFANLYGPTETNVCTFYRVRSLPDDDVTIPIGRAIANTEVFAVTDDGRLAEQGEVGELHVRGAGVMVGYWGDQQRTARSLVPNAFRDAPFDAVYRTGDMVREDAEGDYHLLGRRDSQIKSRGYRIELGEIEAALYAHPAVVECAVVPIPDDVVTNRIKAFVVTNADVGQAELGRFCAGRVPRYMVPEVFEFRGSLPKTSTGKVDKRMLRSDEATAEEASRP